MSAASVPQSPLTASTPPSTSDASAGGVTRFRNAREWLDALGDVPLERIVFDPLPGTATEKDLVERGKANGLCELIEGTLVEKPMGFYEGLIAVRITLLLGNFVLSHKLGVVNGPDGMTRLIRSQVRLPDVAFYPRSLFRGRPVPRESVPALVPDLAVEMISASNSRREMANKLGEYFEAGTRLVWYVDPDTRTIAVYTSPGEPQLLSDADRLTGGDVLVGFDVAVADVFDVLDVA